MTQFTRALLVTALSATSLSGCAIFHDGEVWPGDRTFVQFLTTPIGELLRGTPDEDVQFANETDADDMLVEAEAVETVEAVKVVETGKTEETMSRSEALTWDDVAIDYLNEPVASTHSTTTRTTSSSTRTGGVTTVETTSRPIVETVSVETTSRVLSDAEVQALLRRSGASQVSGSTQTVSSSLSTSPVTKTVSVTETRTSKTGSLKAAASQAELQSMLRQSGGVGTQYTQSEYVRSTTTQPTTTMQTSSSSYSSSSSLAGGLSSTSSSSSSSPKYLTVGSDISSVRMGGGASWVDWRACEAKTGTYWTFDNETHVGRLNPAFETCMTSQNYEIETSTKTEIIPATVAPVTVTTVTSESTLP